MRNDLTMSSLPFNMKLNSTFAITLGIYNMNAGEKDNQYLKISKLKQHLKYGRINPLNLRNVV